MLQTTATCNLPPRKFTFRLPEQSPHTVILWLVDERLRTPETRWVMLIGGDESPMIEVDTRMLRGDDPWWRRRGNLLYYVLLWTLFTLLSAWLTRWVVRNVLP